MNYEGHNKRHRMYMTVMRTKYTTIPEEKGPKKKFVSKPPRPLRASAIQNISTSRRNKKVSLPAVSFIDGDEE